ncbi:MAG: hypothetical protein HY026_11155 [Deltaproteobacteria bacterium]|nr:hypothetical protein [Deltaproteobacteria bacterium]
MKRLLIVVLLLMFTAPVFAIDTAPRISDREIIEKLSALDAKIDKETANLRGDIKELRSGQIALDKRFDDINKRFDTLQWMMGLFITVALFILGAMGKILWNQHKEITQIKTSLETQKDELSFLKTLIEKLLPSKGVL